ncbi:MAG: sigma-70 family RNA polymerase sigma factor [Gemmataceae bacterium]|nr:sigma-70 family RNA polymerase sigma factor [Gemmata sp.]MDW8199320.1 sigma-70 family RNA polymerase sigma factor [Gemmataceae bacterium]
MSEDDRQLIADCLGGNREAFTVLVHRYQARLYSAALRLVQNAEDAADVVQDAFLSAYQSLHTFKGDSEFFTWLYRIAFNTAVSLKRKRKPTLSLEAYLGEHSLDPPDLSEYIQPGLALQRTEDERELILAIARLSPDHREVLLLKELDGLKYEDIAQLLNLPIGTVRSRLHRARLELRELLTALENQRPDRYNCRPSDNSANSEPMDSHHTTGANENGHYREPTTNPVRPTK